ncbi:uroporphyrinogen decarboxylase family protein [Desulfosporosinus sp.]|uniref:uroporphyrinogen decarboxylase family protein n=1 Tax=Desulfosporosinus sp. TaxID=157907 RepID=UPI0025B87AB9|nr:uroporphyrinogen decarboxylase family protein [Desulfosporosinus sp.]MBC2724142.1 uroporphyrinogen decarboxylase [Desulfosporosinus sp.]MBC2724903.1 uroporphyrinogen decarboxylase [Desulfosporosinus sp.]
MTKIERILAATRFERVDRIPKGEFHLEDDLIAELLNLKDTVSFKDRVEACELCGLDALAFSPPFSQPDKAKVWEGIKLWRKETDFFIFAIIDGPFQGTAKLFTSFTDYLLAIAKHDPLLPELVAKSVAANVELGLNALASGANGIIVADDIAYQGGTFISPAALRKDFFPSLAEQVEVLSGQNAPVFFHADGNLLPIIDDIINLGVDGLHSLDFASLADIAKVRLATKNRLCLMGGYDLAWFEEDNRTDKALQLLTATSLESMESGYIFGSSAGILGSIQGANKVLDVYQYVNNLSVGNYGYR